MKKIIQKSNYEYVKEFIEKCSAEPSEKKEAIEFLDAMVEDAKVSEKQSIEGYQDRVKELEETIDSHKSEITELEESLEAYEDGDNNVDVGLDVVRWTLDKGNLRVQAYMEAAMEQLKKKTGMLPA